MSIPKFEKIGFCSKSHGVAGLLRVHADEGYEKILLNARALFFNVNGSMVPQLVEHRQPHGDDWLFQFRRISSKEEAQNYAQSDILMEASSIGQPEEVKRETLEGWKGIESNAGTKFTILKVEEFPQQVMMSVQKDGTTESIYIPLVEDWILDMDEKRKVIRFAFPEGLL